MENDIEINDEEYDYKTIIFFVNGEKVVVTDLHPLTPLAIFLREHLRLTGTKIGCNEGGCGACTVMISEEDGPDRLIRHYSANSCLIPIASLFGKAITTIEGIGNRIMPHSIQERMFKGHGSQCGFCTPGFVMAMYALLRNNPNPTIEEIDEAIQGNLCRCTGYRPIFDAFYSFAKDNSNLQMNGGYECQMGDMCCKKKNVIEKDLRKTLTDFSIFEPYKPEKELIFPPELKITGLSTKSLLYKSGDNSWYQPTTLKQLLALKQRFQNAKFVSGNSEIGIERKFQFLEVRVAINPKKVPELKEYAWNNDCVSLGSALSLTDVNKILSRLIEKLPEWKTQTIRAVVEMLHWFAGIHVRNVATIAGNIITASPISDLNPIWMAIGAQLVLMSEENGKRIVTIDKDFFVGYRKTLLQPNEVIVEIRIPFTNEMQLVRAYKQAQRREDDISIVTGAFMVELDSMQKVKWMRLVYGGVASITKLAIHTANALFGREWNEELIETAIEHLADEFPIHLGAPGGMEKYRQTLVQSLFLKFYLEVNNHFKLFNGDKYIKLQLEKQSEAITSQIYQDVPTNQLDIDPIGRPIAHQSGLKHVTGKALYCDDICPKDSLCLALVLSPIACGELNSVDISEAKKVDGFIDYIDSRDIKEGLKIGVFSDTEVFVRKEISYHCQPIGAVIAKTFEAARLAANRVKINCTKQKPILTVEDAIAAKSYLRDQSIVIHSSMLDHQEVKKSDWSKYKRVIEGSVKIGGQEHFYLETQCCIAIPGEDDEMEIISSTQCINDLQREAARILNVPQHKIMVRVRRIGGAFGGKESAAGIFAIPAAIAAKKLGKPIRHTVERFDDMAISGTRHPFLCKYKLAINEKDELLDYEIELYANCGHSLDLSIGVLQRAIVHADNTYKFSNADIYGHLCRTNIASNTAFRGFGGPQGMFACETMLMHATEVHKLDPIKFREKNLYNEGDCTPYGMHLNQCNIRRCWHECLELSDYYKRCEDVDLFNKQNKFIKRGIYVVPTKFGIGFGIQHLNQASALVHIYRDGSVLVSHGGMEMGQGLHTKILQITARCLRIDIEKIFINDTSTDKVPNASPTAASVGSDLQGMAVMDACNKLNERIKPFKESNPQGCWEAWIEKAYLERVLLSSTGSAVIHYEPVDFSSGKGAEFFSYCVYGVACSEVEVDCLTGDHRVIRVDMVMDVGDSLNPAIDIGQIEGAFVQGYGLFTMEELKIRPDGTRLTRGPSTYKIPSADDIPRQFHVKLLKGSSNKMAIFSSKAVGEPPLFLGSSVFFAIRDAIRAQRRDNGIDGYFRLDSPATPERIRMACIDKITCKIKMDTPSEPYTPWTVEL